MKQNEEPPYIKLYLADLMYLHNLKITHRNLLDALLARCDNNRESCLKVYLTSGRKKEIAEEIGCKVHTIQNALTDLCKREVLKREDTGEYSFNPYLFGRGHWDEIEKARLEMKPSDMTRTEE